MSLSIIQRQNARLKQQLKVLLAKNRQLEDTVAEDVDLIDALTGGRTRAIWDGVHHLWMCPTCLAEIDEAECILSTDEHSITVVSEVEHVDRLPPSEAPEPEGPALPLSRIPESWRRSEAEVTEYRQLIARGATPLMVSTFSLRFTVEEGIVAHGDDTLFDETEISGKIYLGSRVGLDPEDHDGSEFMEGLLEDAILFQQDSFRWETTKTGDGVWETKPCKEFRKVWSDTDSDSDGENIEDWQEEDEADGGEWNSDSDDIGPSKCWDEEAIVVNRYYDTDDDQEEQNEAEANANGDENRSDIGMLVSGKLYFQTAIYQTVHIGPQSTSPLKNVRVLSVLALANPAKYVCSSMVFTSHIFPKAS
ncbi:hypothetical protein BKA70DRAFT_1351386 [Coprinopsis sp. MPI-PUGE-AT-0042]|nr:hypothetical protein BKA70DRAFT_1351386 [Coprinopsis sp. MPI-PUGE-AT-0042]